jgi:hypothetical protein
VPLLYIYYTRFKLANRHELSGFALLLVPAAMVAFMLYMYHITGNPLASFHIQSPTAWDNGLTFPFDSLIRYLRDPELISYYGWDLTAVSYPFVTAAVLMTFWMLIRGHIPMEYGIYAALSVLLIVSRNNLNGSLRYLIPVFPLFLTLALLLNKRAVAYTIVLSIFVSLQAFYFIYYMHSYNWPAT